MTKNKRSFTQKMIALFIGFIALIMVLLLAVVLYLQQALEAAVVSSTQQALGVISQNMESQLRNADQILYSVMLRENDVQALASPQESTRYYASRELAIFMQLLTLNRRGVDMLVVYDTTTGMLVEDVNPKLTYEQKEAIRQAMPETAMKGSSLADGRVLWQPVIRGDSLYLEKRYTLQGQIVAGYILVPLLGEGLALEDGGYLLLDGRGTTVAGFGLDPGVNYSSHRYLLLENQVYPDALSLAAVIDRGAIRLSLQLLPLFLLVMVVATLLLAILFFLFARRNLFLPMKKLLGSMNMIESGNYTHRVAGQGINMEFDRLYNAFNSMLDVIVNLRIQSYEEKLRLQQLQLQNFQLTIKPHFFLNAMSTINSMSMQQQNENIQRYIDHLSQHIRYMFRTGLHTVSLGQEVSHIENYVSMQQFLYPDCVFFFNEIPPEAQNWPVPQMLLHTLVENEYKHAVAMGRLLSIFLSVSLVEQGGATRLRLVLEDDGMGFPKAVLEALGQRSPPPGRRDGQSIGLRNTVDTMQVMYGKTGDICFSNRASGGVSIEIIIPAEQQKEDTP